jgi:uncharacterized protein with HEPN domain
LTREFLDYVEDVLTSMDKAESFVQGISYDDFLVDDKTEKGRLRESFCSIWYCLGR